MERQAEENGLTDTDSRIDRLKEEQTDGWMDRQADKRMVRLTNRHLDGQTDRQKEGLMIQFYRFNNSFLKTFKNRFK
jgi:hypothetical protein